MEKQDIRNLTKLINKYVNKDCRILDVGCGIGENIQILRSLGYNNVVGVDISDDMVMTSREKGFTAYRIDEIDKLGNYDVILFSHILEHIDCSEIQKVMEGYFELCNATAYVIIVMPILYDAFYNDIDHIKPYYPNGLMTLFSKRNVSKQYKSAFELKLIDIEYRTANLLPYNIKCRFLKNRKNQIKLLIANSIFSALKIASLGLLSKKTGYTGLFQLQYCQESKTVE